MLRRFGNLRGSELSRGTHHLLLVGPQLPTPQGQLLANQHSANLHKLHHLPSALPRQRQSLVNPVNPLQHLANRTKPKVSPRLGSLLKEPQRLVNLANLHQLLSKLHNSLHPRLASQPKHLQHLGNHLNPPQPLDQIRVLHPALDNPLNQYQHSDNLGSGNHPSPNHLC